MKKVLIVAIPGVLVLVAAAVVAVLASKSAPQRSLSGEFYLYPVSVELSAEKSDGSSWDALDGSAPDPYVTIEWKGHEVYRSETKGDTLLAHWSLAQFSVARLAASGGRTSVDDQVKAARVSITEGATVTVRVYDDDVMMNDQVGVLAVRLDTLSEGDNILVAPMPGVEKLVLRLLDMQAPPDLLR